MQEVKDIEVKIVHYCMWEFVVEQPYLSGPT